MSSSISFYKVLFTIGAGLLGVLVFHVFARGPHVHPIEPEVSSISGDKEAGHKAIVRYGCGSCHVIPGVASATGRVGPMLYDIKSQTYLAGILTNNHDNMIRWLQNPQQFSPFTAMPDLNVSDTDARNIATYLFQMD